MGGKGNVGIFGKLHDTNVKTGATEAPITYIVMTDEQARKSARSSSTKPPEFSKYYLEKLRLFDQFWFYMNIKDSVDKKIRARRTKELFHADVRSPACSDSRLRKNKGAVPRGDVPFFSCPGRAGAS